MTKLISQCMTKLTFFLFCPLYAHEFNFFQCDCKHEYNDILFHVIGHKVQRDEVYMQLTMADYIENHSDSIKIIAGDFLKHQGQTLDDYLEFIRVPGNKGDELSVHLLVCMTNLKVVVVTKSGF